MHFQGLATFLASVFQMRDCFESDLNFVSWPKYSTSCIFFVFETYRAFYINIECKNAHIFTRAELFTTVWNTVKLLLTLCDVLYLIMLVQGTVGCTSVLFWRVTSALWQNSNLLCFLKHDGLTRLFCRMSLVVSAAPLVALQTLWRRTEYSQNKRDVLWP